MCYYATMVRLIDRAAAVLVGLFGVAHVFVGRQAFFEPTERGVWFLSAGFLLITAALTNYARARLQIVPTGVALAALGGSLSILVCGALLGLASADLLNQPQSLLLLALGALLTLTSAVDLLRRTNVSRFR